MLFYAGMAHAHPVEIVEATAHKDSSGWRFDVTLLHPDTGWDHFADGWSVFTPDGVELGHRQLMHPHVNEQPFTRSLASIHIPEGIDTVVIRARCSVDGWGDQEIIVPLK